MNHCSQLLDGESNIYGALLVLSTDDTFKLLRYFLVIVSMTPSPYSDHKKGPPFPQAHNVEQAQDSPKEDEASTHCRGNLLLPGFIDASERRHECAEKHSFFSANALSAGKPCGRSSLKSRREQRSGLNGIVLGGAFCPPELLNAVGQDRV